MKNLAGVYRCDDDIPGELVYAQIEPVYSIAQIDGEVPTHFTGKLCGWTFRRAWYYWVANGPPLPFKYATPLHELIGTEVRVAGDCGCPSLEERYGKTIPKAIGVPSYHIDTQDGLAIFAATLRKWARDE